MRTSQKIYLPFKRLIGILGSLVGIVVMFVFFWWWILIINTFQTKGHPFFVHERIGKNGKPFKLIKFRSMYNDVDPNATSEAADHSVMVTPFGKFLRATSLDETVQLINVLCGQMAFIGPRPLIYSGEDKITIDERKENGSIKLRSGMSGYAQVNGRASVSPAEKGKLDGYYFEHISLRFDVKLFIQTIGKVIKRKNVEK